MSAISAVRAGDFLGAMGVDTHINYTDSGYRNISADLADLGYLGIKAVRDEAPNPDNDTLGQIHLGNAADAGIKFIFFASGTDPLLLVQRLHDFAAAHPGSIIGIEGPNEVNNFPVTYLGLTGTAAAEAYQSALFNAVKADPLLKNIPVIGFTGPFTASQSDWDNAHPYPKNGDEPRDTILSDVSQQEAADPGKPFVLTETGYHTSLTAFAAGGWEGVDENTQAKLLLNTYMDAAQLGAKQTFIYQLLDAYPDPSGANQEDHFGLFRLDNSPKPAAVAIHNLTTILGDSGANANTFSSGALNYSISGLPSTGHNYLTEKSDGSFQIMVWNEPDVWDQLNDRAIAISATNVTVNLGQTFTTVEIFDPLQGSTPVQALHNVSTVDLGLTDHPLIIQVSAATVQSSSSTILTEIGNNYYLKNSSTGAGPELQFNGAAVVAGEFAGCVPIGAEATATGYEVAWKAVDQDLYTIWNTDSNGHYLGNATGGWMSGSSLESYQPSFYHELVGDGVTGPQPTIPPSVAISSTGGPVGQAIQTISGTVTAGGAAVGTTVDLYDNGSTTPLAIATVQADGSWSTNVTLVGDGSHSIVAEDTDAAGNIGSSAALDFILKTSPVTPPAGSTGLVQIGNNYQLTDSSSGTGPELQFNGAAVVAGEFAGCVPIGAEATATGYEVAWKAVGQDLYTIWNTDSRGNYLGNATGGWMSGSSFKSFEPVFYQNLVNDGVVDQIINAGGKLELANSDSGSVTFSSSTGMLKLDMPSTFTGQIVGFTGDGTLAGSDQIDLVNIAYNSSIQTNSIYNGSTGVLSVSNGSTVDVLHFVGSYSLANFSFAGDGAGGTIVYDPPTVEQPVAASANSAMVHIIGTDGSSGLNAGDGKSSGVDLANFVFAPNFGQATISNFKPGTDTVQIDHVIFAKMDALLAATSEDSHGNAVIMDAAHDSITFQNISAAHLLAHQLSFQFV